MTGFHGMTASKALRAMVTVGAMLSTGAAFAGEATESQILNALQPKPLTRSLSLTPPSENTAAKATEARFVDGLRNRKTRSLSLGEREQIAEVVADKPKIDLEINFDFNSANISSNSMSAVQALGRALTDPTMKGSTFLVAGYTDAVGGDTFNQDLSERRADTIKKYLIEKFGIAGNDLVTVGYGKTKLKNPDAPTDPVNRRVQVANMASKTASSQ